MRSDPIAYRNENYKLNKDIRAFVSIAVDDAGTNKYYFTSHDDVPTPNPAQTIYSVLKTHNIVSQGINADLTISTIGNMSFSLVDNDGDITQFQYDHLVLGEGLREKVVELYQGFEKLKNTLEYVIQQTQVIRSVSARLDGSYDFRCADAMILSKKSNIYIVNKTNLRLDATENDTTISCFNTDGWELNPHGNSYSHLPNTSVYYFKIESATGIEYISAIGKTSDTFTGCERGVLGTKKLEHKIDTDSGVSENKQPEITEVVYIEMPALKLIPALLTGNLYGQIKYDSFTENSITGLENHIADSGGGWSGADTNNFSIDVNGELYLETTGSNWAIGNENPTSADQTTTIEAKISTSSDIAGACVRLNADIDCYEMLLVSSGLWALRKVLNSSVTNLALGTISNFDSDAYHEITIKAIGTTITGFIDNVEMASVTDSDITTPGNIGVYLYNTVAGTSKITSITTEILQGVLPSNWHMNIDPNLVDVSKFMDYATELWDTTSDSGAMVKFIGEEKEQGKKFIERELLKLLVGFLLIGADGKIGIKRITAVLTDSPYVREINKDHVISATSLKHDMTKIINEIDIEWNWDHLREKTTRTLGLESINSRSKHGEGTKKIYIFKGLHSSIHTNNYISTRINTLFDRFASPPLYMRLNIGHEFSDLEVGDVVRVRLDELPDYNTNIALDRSFEIQRILIKPEKGTVSLSLYSSSEKFDISNKLSSSQVLPDSFYESEGNDLSTYVGPGYDAATDYENIAGIGHIKSDCTLYGFGSMNNVAGIYYHIGDLIIDTGVNVTTTNNVQLRTMGVRTVNGTIDGIGQGYKGATKIPDSLVNKYKPNALDYIGHFRDGVKGYFGNTISGGGFTSIRFLVANVSSYEGKTIKGKYDSVPSLDLEYDSISGKLLGIPNDMRGSSGSSGGISGLFTSVNTNLPLIIDYMVNGGNGGNGGASLFEINRGHAFGVNGSINLSGNPGEAPSHLGFPLDANSFTTNNGDNWGGVGAAGAPGIWFCAIDGSLSTRDNIADKIICNYGDMTLPCHTPTTPANPKRCAIKSPEINYWFMFNSDPPPPWPVDGKGSGIYSYYNGTGEVGNNLGGYGPATKEQFIPSLETAEEEDILLPAPTITALETGTNATITLEDGTVLPGVKIYFTPVTDSRVIGYMFEYKKSTDFNYLGAGHILGADSDEYHITGLEKGTTYDFRMKSVGATSQDISEWVYDSILVLGKEDLPPDIVWMQAVQDGEIANITWQRVVISDLSGYTIRYGERGNSNWETANTLTELTKGTKITTGDIPDGDWTVYIKAIDTSGNYSLNAAESDLIFTSAYVTITQEKQVPDWLGTKTNMIVHRTGVLVPNNTVTVASLGWEWVDEYCPNPFTNCYYEREISNGFNDDVRAWSDYGFNLGPGETESNQPLLELDYRTEEDSYDGYETWIKGFATGRYFKFKLSIDTSLGVPYFNLFRPTVDKKSYDQYDNSVSVSNGDTITFPKAFHSVLSVNAFVIGAVPYLLTIDNITGTEFDIGVFNSDASPHVGAITIDWISKGV